ncbi:hypothetical protein OB955_19020 [Halobacteria archaeon AArc-m2/3/4]|uniref:Uncharacterized protein n=1 Tax=Natronoglomus mannanivorans TaxID=2979990 RepID=A0ABT2QIQ4_9EURY|nr:hypothetical protein [Halobacteria archaeon AArc-m2/3/4]
MTSIRDLFGDSLAVGETFCLALEVKERTEDGDETPALVADHPNPNSPADIAVVEGLERLEGHELPPSEPVEIEIVGRFVENRIAGRIVGLECSSADDREFE